MTSEDPAPSPTSPPRLTQILRNALEADGVDREGVYRLVVLELRRIASSALRKQRTGTNMQVTQLVNEAWLKMAHHHPSSWKDRDHFQGWAARVVRSILVDQARARLALKREGQATPVPLTDSISHIEGPQYDLLALDEALVELEQVDPKGARVIELCYFGGMTQSEASAVLDIDESTVKRRSRMARGWLEARLRDD